MSDVLSQNEIDALLDLSDIDYSVDDKDLGIIESQKRISASLVDIHNKLCRYFSSELASQTHALIDIEVEECMILPYSIFMKKEELLFTSTTYYIDGAHEIGSIEIDPEILFFIFDRIMGGRNEVFLDKKRAFTPIEWSLFEPIIMTFLEKLKEVWRPYIILNPKVISSVQLPNSTQIALQNEEIIEVVLVFKIAEVSKKIRIAYPLSIINVFEQEKIPQKKTEIEVFEVFMKDILMTHEEILSMQEGDIINLKCSTDPNVYVHSNGIEVAVAKMGIQEGHRSISYFSKETS